MTNFALATHVHYQAKRYFPVALAEKELANYAARVSAFTALSTTYGTDKTAYEAYLTKAAVKPDFFTSLFSPATAVVPIVVRPNLPTPPEAYTGLYAWPYPVAGYSATGPNSNTSNEVKL